MSSTASFYFRPMENEQIETTIHMRPDTRSCIFGTVKDTSDNPIKDALVLLFDGEDEPRLLSQTYTDDSGQFYFGPLVSNTLQKIKIFRNQIKLRELEVITDTITGS